MDVDALSRTQVLTLMNEHWQDPAGFHEAVACALSIEESMYEPQDRLAAWCDRVDKLDPNALLPDRDVREAIDLLREYRDSPQREEVVVRLSGSPRQHARAHRLVPGLPAV